MEGSVQLRTRIAVTLGCYCLVAAFPGTAGAQTAASSFGELAAKLKPGKTVHVTDEAGRKVKGKMTDLSPSSLDLLVDGKKETFAENSVREITQQRRSAGAGAATGGSAGAIAGVLFGVFVGPRCSCTGEAIALGVGLFGGAGAGVGAAIGAARTHESVVYRSARPGTAARFGLSPFVSKHGTGLAASVRF
jgi:hypothetical protein